MRLNNVKILEQIPGTTSFYKPTKIIQTKTKI